MKIAHLARLRHRRRWRILVAAALTVGATSSSAYVAHIETEVIASSSPFEIIPEGGGSFTPVLGPCDGTMEIADAASTVVENGEYEKPAVLHANRESHGTVALTFDDGPHPALTEPILDLLAEYGIKATFFTIGVNAKANPELIERELAEGHEVGNHTQTHPDLSKLSYEAACDEVLAAEKSVYEKNSSNPHLLRPPGGNVGESVIRLAKSLDYNLVLWSIDTRDWEHTDTDKIVRTVSDNVESGDVILFHDYISGESHTLEALRRLIPELISEGYEFVTVSELFDLR